MGKYFDDYEREADYQNWLYYRESSHEERESQRKYIHLNKTQDESKLDPMTKAVECSGVDIFRDYPDHQAKIAVAEKKYFKSYRKLKN